MRFATRRRADPLVDVTPMIDIVFQLVLFFMVSTTFIENNPGFQVDLPRSSAQAVVTEKDDLNVWMTCGQKLGDGTCTEGSVYVNEEPVTVATLEALFDRAAEKDRDTLVIVKADVGVAHGRVVKVMDLARVAGLTRIAIATEAPDERLN